MTYLPQKNKTKKRQQEIVFREHESLRHLLISLREKICLPLDTIRIFQGKIGSGGDSRGDR